MTDARPLHCIIGSGPAGVACAQALLEGGARVLMLDAGVSLEPDRADLINQIRQVTPSKWTPDQIARLKEGTSVSAKGIPLKLAFGSDFPYRGCDEEFHPHYEGVGLRPSLAQGGLSNVWGAVMMPYTQRDITDWPVSVSHLAEHYAAVLKFAGISSRSDDLEKLFPLYQSHPSALDLSRQAKQLLTRMDRNRNLLADAGVSFGQARVAIQTRQPDRAGCCYCGLCMYGCPYGYIYNSESTLRQLQRNTNFNYKPGVVVTLITESTDSVTIKGHLLPLNPSRLLTPSLPPIHNGGEGDKSPEFVRDGAPFEMEAARVYLAAGVIPTTQILLRSQSLYEQPVRMLDSQYFLLPLALTKSVSGVRSEALHTLCQLFIEIFDAEISPYTVHLQIYSYNDLISQAVRQKLGPLARPLDLLARNLEGRLLVIQGYLHSKHSAQIEVALRKGPPEGLCLKACLNPETKPAIQRIIRKLSRLGRQLGAFPLPPMLQIGEPGRGFHSGGTFPMRKQPQRFASDLLGRPQGWSRVHAVDATVLPTIPATSITFSVMANAHRIGWESAQLR